MRLLALDFDGVLSDSAPEAFVVAVRTYAALREDAPFPELVEALAGPEAPPAERFTGDPVYARFLEMMALGNRAEDYAAELRAIERRAAIPDQGAFDRLKGEIDPDWLRSFHKRFYRERRWMFDAAPDAWHRLIGPYPELLAMLRRRAGEVELAIATSKDRRSVQILLDTYGVGDLFPDGRVLDKEMGASKAVHMEHLRERFACGFGDITFIDDKVNHLDSVSGLGVRCALARWGYNGSREVRLARERGYLVCGLDDVEGKLFGGRR